ncbi:MAG: guanylate kinase [Deltaproteobacteria bacterium RIFCSPLOWO2_02_FULL_44_10]|nr:MAG: guanylate kinase [Deltaproteobacteria bacterium RIFCSPHIGHO2_02_FULL_44_16]OGQ46643.1 MAG: guanylate kinase [Deltaproteobacteria bacterium RIFCSPLOWO2_02_FULL_44_10]
MKKGRLIVISAPSGTGKSTVVRKLCERMPELEHSISSTTRSKRPGEVQGVHYDFISDAEFQKRKNAGYFLECAQVHGASYGTPKNEIEKMLAQGKNILMDIDVQGGMQVKKNVPDAIMIFLLPPNMNVLEERLRRRGTDREEDVKTRLENANEELSYQDRYEHCFVNDDLEKTLSALQMVLKKYAHSNS